MWPQWALNLSMQIGGCSDSRADWATTRAPAHYPGRSLAAGEPGGSMFSAECLSHEECPQTGFCDLYEGICKIPGLLDPCQLEPRDTCSGDLICNPYSQRCDFAFSVSEPPPSRCTHDSDCLRQEYCARGIGKCVDRRGEGRACSMNNHCGEGMLCVDEVCTKLCRSADDCPGPEYKCAALHVTPLGGCILSIRKLRTALKLTPNESEPISRSESPSDKDSNSPAPTQPHRGTTAAPQILGLLFVALVLFGIVQLLRRKRREQSMRPSQAGPAEDDVVTTVNPYLIEYPSMPEPPSYEDAMREGATMRA